MLEQRLSSLRCLLRSSRFFTICFILLVGAFGPVFAQKINSIDRDRALDMLHVVKSDIKKNYYDPNFRGINLDERFATAEEKIKGAASMNHAMGIIAQVLLDFDDSHTFFSPPSRAASVEYGWTMLAVGDVCYVSAVKPGSDAEAKGLKPGDIVQSIEGLTPTRKDLWKMNYYFYNISPRAGLNIVVVSPDGQRREVSVKGKVKQGKRVLDLTNTTDINNLIREAENEDRLNRHRFYKAGGMVVWKMPGFDFDPEQAKSIINDRTKGYDTLVLDLRGNQGGYVDTLVNLTERLFDHDVKIADLKGRKEMKPMTAKTAGKNVFTGKLIVLVDSKSASASEILARLVQIEKRGVVIGDRTAGAVMQSKGYSHQMGTDTIVAYGASITDADVIMTDGKSVEHVGVTPDELLIPTAVDMAANRDPVLARAAELSGVTLTPEKAATIFPVEWK